MFRRTYAGSGLDGPQPERLNQNQHCRSHVVIYDVKCQTAINVGQIYKSGLDFSHLKREEEDDEESSFQLRLVTMFTSRWLRHRCPTDNAMNFRTMLIMERMHLSQI